MGHLDVSAVSYHLPDGRVLLRDATFRVREGAKVALIGANGTGKTTLLRILAGELLPGDGVDQSPAVNRRVSRSSWSSPARLCSCSTS